MAFVLYLSLKNGKGKPGFTNEIMATGMMGYKGVGSVFRYCSWQIFQSFVKRGRWLGLYEVIGEPLLK